MLVLSDAFIKFENKKQKKQNRTETILQQEIPFNCVDDEHRPGRPNLVSRST